MRNSHYSPFLLLETSGFSELLWAPSPWTPSKALPWGPYSTPRPPAGKGNDLCFACRYNIIKNPTNFWPWWWWFDGGHMKFSQIERGGSTIFLLLPGGDKKFNRVFYPVSTTPPSELKNDNSPVLKVVMIKNVKIVII